MRHTDVNVKHWGQPHSLSRLSLALVFIQSQSPAADTAPWPSWLFSLAISRGSTWIHYCIHEDNLWAKTLIKYFYMHFWPLLSYFGLMWKQIRSLDFFRNAPPEMFCINLSITMTTPCSKTVDMAWRPEIYSRTVFSIKTVGICSVQHIFQKFSLVNTVFDRLWTLAASSHCTGPQ